MLCPNVSATAVEGHESCWQSLAPDLLANIFHRVRQELESDPSFAASRQACACWRKFVDTVVEVITLDASTGVFDANFERFTNLKCIYKNCQLLASVAGLLPNLSHPCQ